MKVLILFCSEFGYHTGEKNIESAEFSEDSKTFKNCIVAFIQIEASDELLDLKGREKKLVNHLKWACRKNKTKNVVLHSFAHLSESKASLDFSKDIFNLAQKRLENSEFKVSQTPWGYFLDLNLKAPGFSLARIWANL